MINKGKGCFSAIFDGSIPIALVKHGLDTVFQKPSEPVEPTVGYVSNGLIAHFSGEDDYNGGVWLDRVSGYKFTPVSSDTAPVHDATNKLYEATQFGGMLSDFTIPVGSDFTFEVVTRDIKNNEMVNLNANYGMIVGCAMKNWDIDNGGVFLMNWRYEVIALRCNGGNTNAVPSAGIDIPLNSFIDNALDTFTIVPNVGLFRNGEWLIEAPQNTIERGVGLFTHYSGSYTSSFRTKGKIHSVRMYNRQLTADEVMQNYKEDLRIYDNAVQSNFLLADGNILITSDGNVFNTKEV